MLPRLTPARQKRLYAIVAVAVGVGIAISLVLYALKQNISVYLTPSQVAAGQAPMARAFRLGGWVKAGSVHRGAGLEVDFVLTDLKHALPVRYVGVLPALFHEGRGAVVDGQLDAQGVFVAGTVLAKHDERYRPPASP